MIGKEKCRILREIRRRIADENDIPFVTRECHFRGECRGTCPRCESELRYLERQLALRASLGRRVAVAALCAGLGLGASACSPFGGDAPEIETDLTGAVAYIEPAETPGIEVETGEIAWPEEDGTALPPGVEPEAGEVLWPEEDGQSAVSELTGDVAYVPEAGND